MKVLAELASLEAQGVVVWAQDNKLRYVSDVPISSSLKSRLTGLKSEALQVWQQSDVMPMELSGLQQAYWLGEDKAFREHSPAFLHLVFAGDFPADEQLQAALDKLTERHPPLAYHLGTEMPIFEKNGGKRPEITLCAALPGHAANTLDAIDIAQPVLDGFGSGEPLFHLLVVDDGSRKCLHGIFRLVLFDAFSITRMLDELIRLANGEQLNDTSASYDLKSFRAYEARRKRQRLRARQYWVKKVKDLPGPARSLLRMEQGSKRSSKRCFLEYRESLDADKYDALKQRAQTAGVSVNAVLITCYLSTLARWNEAKQCCASVMYSQRPNMPEQHADCIGNFGTLLLLGGADDALSFKEKVHRVHNDLFEAMSHSAYDGVSVIRNWAAQTGASMQAGDPPMPFVFSTLVGNALNDVRLQQVGHRMMTPQVWIDAQAFEEKDKLILSWDHLEGSLPDEVVSDMMAYFSSWVAVLATDETAWSEPRHVLPQSSLEVVKQCNATAYDYTATALVENIFDIAAEDPDRIAFWHHDGNLSFRKLASKASLLAQHLCENGVGPGDNVVVCGERTTDLMIAIYAVVLASGTYVPVTPQTPVEKIKRIIRTAAATTILADSDETITAIRSSPVVWTENYNTILEQLVDEDEIVEPTYPIDPQQLAYIIFTSGTTGTPKGVAVTHEAATNTLRSCARAFGLSDKDRILAISDVNFDLSVYDIFMPALFGCSAILPATSEWSDPAHWVEAATAFDATIWNSVPAILHMAVTYTQKGVSDLRLPTSLRLVMVSGDWVPLDLASGLKKAVPECAFIALGGATEASIWSNYFIVDEIDPDWRSVPYGRPLDNQRLYILDRFGALCPRGVAGQLHIAGDGLAKCYINDDAQTQERFFVHPDLQQRLYNTGDLVRFMPSGEVEFLGRDDHQVQVNGFRVELSGIEHVAEGCEGIHRAMAVYSLHDDKLLHLAYVADQADANIQQRLKAHLDAHLSHYMVPHHLYALADVPLSANGKIDRQQLASLMTKASVEHSLNESADSSELSHSASLRAGSLRLLESVQSVLPSVTGLNQNWFDSGCSSIDALHLLQRLNQSLGLRLELPDIYRTQSVDALAALVLDGDAQGDSTVWLNRMNHTPPCLVVFVHPVGGSIACYMEAANALRGTHDVAAFCADEASGYDSINDLAAGYYAQISSALPAYSDTVFAGWSLGGSVALEMARHAQAAGVSCTRVVTIDSFVGDKADQIGEAELFTRFVEDIQGNCAFSNGAIPLVPTDLDRVLAQRYRIFSHNYRLLERYTPAGIDLAIVNFAADHPSNMRGLRPLPEALPNVQNVLLPGDHFSILDPPARDEWVAAIRQTNADQQRTVNKTTELEQR